MREIGGRKGFLQTFSDSRLPLVEVGDGLRQRRGRDEGWGRSRCRPLQCMCTPTPAMGAWPSAAQTKVAQSNVRQSGLGLCFSYRTRISFNLDAKFIDRGSDTPTHSVNIHTKQSLYHCASRDWNSSNSFVVRVSVIVCGQSPQLISYVKSFFPRPATMSSSQKIRSRRRCANRRGALPEIDELKSRAPHERG